ncbi:hypothetical protein BGZ97_007556 [Linnemannia gamsii]|uniref:Uncharacterized protein n=1 Tax=Linnemannia gamsii TaxID=64522 RepID=A0A9P6QQJ0_9FUNG|nr:hypothetical protein BGZ97_007556 [Linnemannia gamsii]
MSSSSAQASETLDSPCTVTSFGAIMSGANQQYSLHALKRARQKALYEYFQSQRDENGIQSGTQDQQRDSIPSQQQGSPLATSTFATPRVQQEDFYNKQNNQEVDMRHLKATTEKVEETRAKEEEAGPIRIQVTLSQWSRIKELSTELYLKAVKSYDDSRDADRVASESHDRFMDASKHWYAMTGQHFLFD